MAVWDLQTKFLPRQIGAGLARLWAIDGYRLVPVVDVNGSSSTCPITLEPFDDPVLLGDGFVYERKAALTWLQEHQTAPCTNEILPHRTALRLQPLHAAIESFISKSPALHASFAEERLTNVITQADCFLARRAGNIDAIQSMLVILEHALGESLTETQAWSNIAWRIEERQRQLRIQQLDVAACVIQRRSRRFLARCALLAAQVQRRIAGMHSISTLQGSARTFLARQLLLREKAHCATVQVQSASRRFLAQRRLGEFETDRNKQLQKQFCMACHLGNIDFVRLLVDRGVDKNSCATLDVDVARQLYVFRHEPWTPTTTALYAASRQGHTEIVRFLCELCAGTAAISVDFSGWERTPLCTAAKQGHCDVVRLLCEAHADVDWDACDRDIALVKVAKKWKCRDG